MKTSIILSVFRGNAIAAILLAAGTLGSVVQSQAAGEESDYAQKLSKAHLFLQPLICIGTNAPDLDETRELYSAAGLDADHVPADRLGSMESFAKMHPRSPWTPSLCANLARYYRSQGRYSAALDAWQQAWNETKDLTDVNGRKVADYALAYWSELLESLGRVEKLRELTAFVGGRQLSSPEFQRQFDLARQAVVIMVNQPGASFRCGSLALYHVARALDVKKDLTSLEKMESPATGFSLAQLAELSDQFGLGLAAVKRPSGSELVVPSVIHWKENHYAAIVEKRNGGYRVIDPTFDRPQWLSAGAINENASGYFLIPTNQMPTGWQVASAEDARKTFGKGIQNAGDHPSGPRCDSSADPGLTCPLNCPVGGGKDGGNAPSRDSGSGGDGGGGCGSKNGVGACHGMPDWEVQEPYISVWLHDRPMFYNMSFGREFLFQVDYHQREDIGGRYNQTFGDLGPNWNCNLLTYIRIDGNILHQIVTVTNCLGFGTNCVTETNSGTIVATEYCPDGGQIVFSWGGTNIQSAIDPHTHIQFLPAVVIESTNYSTDEGYEEDDTTHYVTNTLVYPNGSVAVFDLILTNSIWPEQKFALLTSATDPQGHVMKYSYTNNGTDTLLTQVVDFDGKTNKFIYGNGTFPTSITQVTNTSYRFGVNFTYDGNGRLTNILDMAGIKSSFQYTLTNEVYYTNEGVFDGSVWYTNHIAALTSSVWLLTALKTPYGDTKFDYFHASWPLFGANIEGNINRAITVTQPDLGKHLFLYLDEAIPPFAGPGWYPDIGSTGNAGFDYNRSNYLYGTWSGENIDNSYHWGPRQYALLSTSILTNLNSTDINFARIRNWLHSNPENIVSVGEVLNAEQDPGPDADTSGRAIWYSYEGKPETPDGPFLESTNDDLPTGFGRRLDPFNLVNYENIARNTNGLPTNVVDFGRTGDGTISIRTNTYIYSGNNIDLLQHIGPDGVAQETYFYDGHHQVTSMSNALCEVTSYTYNAMGQVTGITQPNGLVTANTYGADGFLATTYDYSGSTGYRTNSYTYTNGLVRTHTDERGLTTTNTWDLLQRITRIDYPDGTSINYTYDKLDLVRVIDRMGFTNSYAYDSMRRKVSETNALGNATVYTYCACGALERIEDALGNITRFDYDDAGRLTNMVYADTSSVGRIYDLGGLMLNVTGSSGKNTGYQYDGLLRKTVALDAADYGNPVLAAYKYDLNDLITNQVDANGVSMGMTYDALHRLRTRAYPDGGVEKFGYTPNFSGMTTYTNQLTNVWTYAYDLLSRKTNEIAKDVYTNSFAYSPAGDLLVLLDGKNQATTWKYDLFGRMTNKLDNLGANLFIYAYDADNRLTNRISAAKGSTIYSYDNVGNLTFINYPASPDITLQYDALNRVTNMVDAVGTTMYSYDAVGQVLSEDGPWDDDTVSYAYANRLRTGLTVAAPNASEWVQSYGYDLLDRLTNVTSSAGSFGYDLGYDSSVGYVTSAGSLVHKLSLPNGAYITNTFDSVARMTGTYLRNSGDTNLDTEDYVYNLGGQRTQQVFTAGNFMNYGYDSIGELKTAKGKESGGVTNRMQEQFGYVYDAAGNLNFRTNNTLLSQFNANSLNELTTVTNGGKLTVAGATTSLATSVTVNSISTILYKDTSFASTNQSWGNGNNTYTAVANDSYGRQDTDVKTVNLQQTNKYAYDLNGNMVTNGTRVLEYDDENQLIRISEPNAWKSEFTYDGKMRRRIRKEYTWNGSSWLQTNELHFIYDGNSVVQERDRNNLPQITYTRGRDVSGGLQIAGGIGGLLARTEMTFAIRGSDLAHAFFHADGNGNITALIFTNQTIAAKYEYDPYGNILSKAGVLADANLYRFSSKEFDAVSGLIYYLYRYYDPNLQRWPNRDPIHEFGFLALKGGKLGFHTGSELNLYTFVGNDPIIYIDVAGLHKRLGGLIGGKCCNKSKEDQWWLDDGVWKKLPAGKCTGTWDDCDGMTCGGGFYYIQDLDGGSCDTPGKDCNKFGRKRWTPGSQGPDAQSPHDRGAPNNDPPPGYGWGIN